MKKLFYIYIALILIVGITYADVYFNTEIQNLPLNMKIYETKINDLSKAQLVNRLRTVIETAGYDVSLDSTARIIENKLSIKSGDVVGLINKDGSKISFSNFKALKLDENVIDLPSDNDAVDIALSFLYDSGLVSRENSGLYVEHIGGIMQVLATPMGDLRPQKKAVVVYFNRKLDGYPVLNGSSITVRIGDNYLPIGLVYNWREIKRTVGEVTPQMFISKEEIYELIRNDIANSFNPDSEDIFVTKIYPVYYDSGKKYIQPAICYEAETKGLGLKIRGFVPLLQNPPEEVVSPHYSQDLVLPEKLE